jgi:probable HAF family extracellular repeat protein
MAYCVNNRDQVVGYSNLSGDAGYHAFLYENGVMEDLNDLIPAGSNLDLKLAVGINEAGQILANSGDSGTGHAYLLTPIPEPSAVILSSLFGVLLLVLRRKR